MPSLATPPTCPFGSTATGTSHRRTTPRSWLRPPASGTSLAECALSGLRGSSVKRDPRIPPRAWPIRVGIGADGAVTFTGIRPAGDDTAACARVRSDATDGNRRRRPLRALVRCRRLRRRRRRTPRGRPRRGGRRARRRPRGPARRCADRPAPASRRRSHAPRRGRGRRRRGRARRAVPRHVARQHGARHLAGRRRLARHPARGRRAAGGDDHPAPAARRGVRGRGRGGGERGIRRRARAPRAGACRACGPRLRRLVRAPRRRRARGRPAVGARVQSRDVGSARDGRGLRPPAIGRDSRFASSSQPACSTSAAMGSTSWHATSSRSRSPRR